MLKSCLLGAVFSSSRARKSSLRIRPLGNFQKSKATDVGIAQPYKSQGKVYLCFVILYNLLLVAQALMCILEIVRLSLAHLGTGLLGFIFVSLITAGALRFTHGINGIVFGWNWINLALWISLAITNGVKVLEEVKEGIHGRKGSKYPIVDQITDVSVMIGVYVVLGILEICLGT